MGTEGAVTPREAIDREGGIPKLTALRAFVVATQYRSFSRTAEELGVTQSGVSRAIRSIEDGSGVKLFERTGHGSMTMACGTLVLMVNFPKPAGLNPRFDGA